MYRTSDSPALPHALNGGSPHRREVRHCVAFDLIVPGLDSSPAREMLAYAFGAGTQAYVVQTSRLHDCTTLYVETDRDDINDVIGMLTAHFPNATLGRVTRVTRH
ncbi:hypothetical protein [Caballeronia ptereochthonis]|uniref:AsnC family transcriptional regulator n=1 Tax=Caballeronia ptereochthonis TaxID=1777144 RepID=A0A158BZ51_9BURK|nr:hypothetical protein [Caballeronia ptereochthonis]SAK75271.1 hypothetical protein AWB83_03822 [Caballeronia ptereochthonis]